MEEQERGRSIQVEGACAEVQGLLPNFHPALLCWQHLGSLRSRMIEGKKLKACWGAISICLVDLDKSEDFRVKSDFWILQQALG